MKQVFNSIFRKIIFLTIAIVAIFGIAVTGSLSITRMEEERCWQTLGDSAISISREITLRLTDNMNILHLVAEVTVVEGLIDKQEELSDYLRRFHKMTIFERVDVIFPDKSVLLMTGELKNIQSEISFEELAQKGEHISGRRNDILAPERQVVYFYMPIKDGNETIAILVGVLSCDELDDIFSTQIYNGETHICIVDTEDGVFVMDDWHSELGDISILALHKPKHEYHDKNIVEEIMAGRTGEIAYVSAINGRDSYMHYTPVGIGSWQLLVVAQEEVAFYGLVHIKNMLTIITASVLLVLIIYYVHAIIVNYRLLKTKKVIEDKLNVSDTLLECVRTLSSQEEIEPAVKRLLFNVREFFEADRAYIYEIDYAREVVNNSYEDLKQGVNPEIGIMQEIPLSSVQSWIEAFDKKGLFIIRDLHSEFEADSIIYESLVPQKIHSMVAILLKDKNKTIGFLGIDNPQSHMDDFALISSLSYFLMDSISKRETQTLLEKLSYEDTLTGLYNRNKYNKVMDEFEDGTRKVKSLGFAYYDLNGLKALNDRAGHKAGDLLLQNMAKCLSLAFGPDAYRIGGDEFTVILPDISQEAFNKMTDSVKQLLAEQGISVAVGISWRGGDYDISKQMAEADKEMYKDKRKHYMKNDRRKTEE